MPTVYTVGITSSLGLTNSVRETVNIMGFMQKQIYFDQYFEVETTCGTEIVPSDVIGRTCATHVEALLDYLEGDPLDADELCPIHEGWVARLSAPGYMDCTTWSAHKSAEDAEEFLDEMYGDNDEEF